jgi:hypothetical protein
VSPVPQKEEDVSILSNHFPHVLAEIPPDPYDVAEPAGRDPGPAGEPLEDWPDDRWGLCFPDDVPEDADVVLVPPQEGGA